MHKFRINISYFLEAQNFFFFLILFYKVYFQQKYNFFPRELKIFPNNYFSVNTR